MNKNKASVIVAVIAAVAGLAGAVEGGFINFNYTNVDSHDDNRTFVETYIFENYGVDIPAFKEMCINGEVGPEAIGYCKVVGVT